MAEVNMLEPIPALYDFVLYFECAPKDWLSGANKSLITGNGSLLNFINWNSKYSYDPDDAGGRTLFGVTESSWNEFVKLYPEKGYSKDLNSMGKQGWLDQINWYWNEKSSSGKCANYACAFLMFQMVWVGFGSKAQSRLLNTLITNADKKDYPFIKTGNNYRKIADATHAYSDPMIAYDYMRKANAAYYYNISTPDRTNKKYRMGWLNRATLSYTPYGLYIPTFGGGSDVGLKYSSTLEEWENAALQLAKTNANGYVKIMDWGATPESIENMINNAYNYTNATESFSPNASGKFSSGVYGGGSDVLQLGSYTVTPSIQTLDQQSMRREDVLNTLLGGLNSSNDVKTCDELITTDKKKNKKQKSEK